LPRSPRASVLSGDGSCRLSACICFFCTALELSTQRSQVAGVIRKSKKADGAVFVLLSVPTASASAWNIEVQHKISLTRSLSTRLTLHRLMFLFVSRSLLPAYSPLPSQAMWARIYAYQHYCCAKVFGVFTLRVIYGKRPLRLKLLIVGASRVRPRASGRASEWSRHQTQGRSASRTP